MMYWGYGGWGMAFMTIGTVLFWGLVIVGVVVLVRRTGGGTTDAFSRRETSTPQQVLAERFARGEIDEAEYNNRMQVLDHAAHAAGTG